MIKLILRMFAVQKKREAERRNGGKSEKNAAETGKPEIFHCLFHKIQKSGKRIVLR